jgi:hypothetical protein
MWPCRNTCASVRSARVRTTADARSIHSGGATRKRISRGGRRFSRLVQGAATAAVQQRLDQAVSGAEMIGDRGDVDMGMTGDCRQRQALGPRRAAGAGVRHPGSRALLQLPSAPEGPVLVCFMMSTTHRGLLYRSHPRRAHASTKSEADRRPKSRPCLATSATDGEQSIPTKGLSTVFSDFVEFLDASNCLIYLHLRLHCSSKAPAGARPRPVKKSYPRGFRPAVQALRASGRCSH